MAQGPGSAMDLPSSSKGRGQLIRDKLMELEVKENRLMIERQVAEIERKAALKKTAAFMSPLDSQIGGQTMALNIEHKACALVVTNRLRLSVVGKAMLPALGRSMVDLDDYSFTRI